MLDMSWNDAIVKVLKESDVAMKYTDISKKIEENKFRKSFGATPSKTVNSHITSSIKKDVANSPFIKVGKGEYFLREKIDSQNIINDEKIIVNENDFEEKKYNSIIHAFGMFWQRDMIYWKSNPNLFGQENISSDRIDFSNQIGVYFLYDGRDVIYVGQTINLGARLYQHTQGRLKGRWDRFSWFGLHKVTEEAKLQEVKIEPTVDVIISTLEALCIEGLEPPQNRKRGDDFDGIEYIQSKDPVIEKQQMKSLLKDLQSKL